MKLSTSIRQIKYIGKSLKIGIRNLEIEVNKKSIPS